MRYILRHRKYEALGLIGNPIPRPAKRAVHEWINSNDKQNKNHIRYLGPTMDQQVNTLLSFQFGTV